VDRVAALGQTAVALTDHGVMYGVIDFYRACKKKGIHPVIGCEVYLAPRSRFDRHYNDGESHSHLILLCENQTGYQNLIRIVSLAFSEGFYKKPRIDMELLKQHSEGLICLSACLAGVIPQALMKGDRDKARQLCQDFLAIFDRKHFYLEIQDHGIPEQQKVNEGLYQLAKELRISLVATNDAHYLTREDAKSQDVLMAIQTGKSIHDPNRLRFETNEFYIKSGEEMAVLFPKHPEALANMVVIAERCQVDFTFGKYHLPEFDVPEGYTALEYLQKLCDDGFTKRYPNDDGTIRKRLQYEINMIAQMGFVDYFLIVSDFIHYAKSQDIPVGPGRGSAAGSVVSYCLGITDLDPIHYSLYFERFLNPERVSMPDIDVDFCYERRSEVVDYVTRKYGKDCVVQIVTFGTLAAKNAIRDVGRVLDIPYNKVNAISKMIPEELHMTIGKALEMNPQLREQYDTSPQVHSLIDTAQKLEGMPRHASTHAAGVVITKNPVDTYVPLSRNDGQMVAQFNMVTLEELGLLKMDFLGLRTLTVIADAEKMIRKHTPNFSIETIPLDDAATYDMLARGETMGVFQLESTGITNVVMGLHPQSIEDITAVVALYRPGPMQSIPRYVECRHNPEKVVYKHPLLEPILKVTYGCMIYQEQVMQVFQKLAGYSLGKADMVRRAMSKKKMKELEKERVTFIHGDESQGIDGAIKRGVPESVAAELFDEIMDFANYAFNKAHAVCYAFISYRTAYLKCHYPREFMAALLTSVLDVSDKVSEYVQAVRRMGIAVLPPDINQSNSGFSVDGNCIRFGLSAVKSVSRTFMEQLMEAREKNGAFDCFQDFCERMYPRGLNSRVLDSLCKVGAFDSMGYRRSQLLAIEEEVLRNVAKAAKRNIEGQINLFDLFAEEEKDTQITIPDIPEQPKLKIYQMERGATGLYLSGHPMDEYRQMAEQVGAVPLRELEEALSESDGCSSSQNAASYSDGSIVRLACILSTIQQRTTKKGELMAFVTVEDQTGSMELVVFPRVYQQFQPYLVKDKVVLVTGKVSMRDNEGAKVIVNELVPLNEKTVADIRIEESSRTTDSPYHTSMIPDIIENQPKGLYLRVLSLNSQEFTDAARVVSSWKGDVPVVFCLTEEQGRRVASEQFYCWVDPLLLKRLYEVIGEKNVYVQKQS